MTRAAMATSAAPPTIGQTMLVGVLFGFAKGLLRLIATCSDFTKIAPFYSHRTLATIAC